MGRSDRVEPWAPAWRASAPTWALGDLVNELPGSARVLESFGIDYCCGGQRSLGRACDELGIDVAQVVDALSQLVETAPEDWAAMSPDDLVDHLESTHHRWLRDELPRLEALASKVAAVHSQTHPELVGVLADVRGLRADLEPHMLKEERVLFPMVRQLCSSDDPVEFHCGSVRNPISVMLAEHDATGALLSRLRIRTDGFEVPDDGCASYRELYAGLEALEADTHLHVHKENNLLFPAVVELEQRASAR